LNKVNHKVAMPFTKTRCEQSEPLCCYGFCARGQRWWCRLCNSGLMKSNTSSAIVRTACSCVQNCNPISRCCAASAPTPCPSHRSVSHVAVATPRTYSPTQKPSLPLTHSNMFCSSRTHPLPSSISSSYSRRTLLSHIFTYTPFLLIHTFSSHPPPPLSHTQQHYVVLPPPHRSAPHAAGATYLSHPST
jgi:hypothetical protein